MGADVRHLFSSLNYTATTTATYYVAADGFASNVGTYTMSVIEGSRSNYDVDMAVGSLLRPDATWSTPGTPAVVTWAVRDTFAGSTDASGAAAPFFQLSAAQIAAVQAGLGMFSDAAQVTFNQQNPGGTSDNATMLFSSYTSATDGAGAYAHFPGDAGVASEDGDVRLNNNSVSTTDLPFGSFSFFAIIHEMGHAMGMHHPGPYNAAPGQSITYNNHAVFIQDSQMFTVMSYFDESNTNGDTPDSNYADTLMLFDIAAMQLVYGANMNTRAGNTIYGFNSNAGAVYDFALNTDPKFCIWDGAGVDMIVASQFTMDQVIRLGEGTFSNIGGFMNNVSIAFGAEIERAIGGSGNDMLVGNTLDNLLRGNNGNDTISGGGGRDFLQGSNGEDILNGGNHNDVLQGGNHNDMLFGDAGNDKLFGDDGWDELHGGDDKDILDGGTGRDTLFGDGGNDQLNGGDDADVLWGGDLHDVLRGGNGVDFLHGGTGIDRLFGDAGNDWLYGDGGNDVLTGGADSDRFLFAAGSGFDRIVDFTDNVDTLVFDQSLWGGGIMTAADVISTFGSITSGGTTVTFNFAGEVVTLLGYGPTGLGSLVNDILVT